MPTNGPDVVDTDPRYRAPVGGGWTGNIAFSPTLGAFFLAVGVGAILQVVVEVTRLVADQGRVGTATNLLAAFGGFAVMYATDLLVAV